MSDPTMSWALAGSVVHSLIGVPGNMAPQVMR